MIRVPGIVDAPQEVVTADPANTEEPHSTPDYEFRVAARCLLLAHRVISVRCGIWSLSGHSGLWRAVRPADLRVHTLGKLRCASISLCTI